jgi:hypothetical protein
MSQTLGIEVPHGDTGAVGDGHRSAIGGRNAGKMMDALDGMGSRRPIPLGRSSTAALWSSEWRGHSA